MEDSLSQRSLAAVKGLYAAFEAGDVAAAFAYLDENLTITYPASMPMAGEWRGHEGLGALFTKVNDLWQERQTEVHRFIADGENVFVMVTTTGKVNGRHVVMPISEFYRVKDGKVVEGRPFFWDTAMVTEALA